MLNTIFATKIGMMQAWSDKGKRLAVTRCKISDNIIVGKQEVKVVDYTSKTRDLEDCTILEIGTGKKKLKNVPKSLRTRLEKNGFKRGVSKVTGLRVKMDEISTEDQEKIKVGNNIDVDQVLSVGDVVQVQGTSKGRGFAGVMKRHGFHGGPATHGQSDRARAPGSIGAGTYPGRVWKGKKMPGHYGTDIKTVGGLVIIHIDKENNELWISGPVPGFNTSTVKITKTGKKKDIKINFDALNINNSESQKEESKEEPKKDVPEEKSEKKSVEGKK